MLKINEGRFWLAVALAVILQGRAAGQVQSREAEIEAARDAKAARLSPDQPGAWEQRLIYVKDAKVLERISAGVYGVRVKIGGMATGAGFALGPEYIRSDIARGEILFRASAQASMRGSLKHELEVGAPSFGGNRFFWNVQAVHQNYGGIPYYGPGPDSEKTARSNYRIEDTAFDTMLGVKPFRFLRAGVSGGYLKVNTGPGNDSRYISAERRFSPADVAGLDHQTDFLRHGAFLQFDYRDNPAGARGGGNYTARFDRYGDRGLRRHSFQRLDLEAQQYLPLFNKRRVFALRGRTTMSFTNGVNRVPFYQQQVLGGSDDLRGYRPYRFHGDNMMVMNAEYRWEVFSGFDMAVFADAGKVTMRRSDLNFKDLESSVGFGLRFNVRNATFLRIDTGFSHEGFQVWFKFSNIFAQRPFGSSSAPHIQ